MSEHDEDPRKFQVRTGDEPTDPASPDDEEKTETPTDPNAGFGLDADGFLCICPVRRTIPVKADFGDGVKLYTIAQMTGREKGEYQEFQSKQAVYKRGVLVGLKPGAVRDQEIELVHRCLYAGEWVDGPGNNRVLRQVIQTWSAEAIEKLVRVCEKLNCVGSEKVRLMEEADEAAKNG